MSCFVVGRPRDPSISRRPRFGFIRTDLCRTLATECSLCQFPFSGNHLHHPCRSRVRSRGPFRNDICISGAAVAVSIGGFSNQPAPLAQSLTPIRPMITTRPGYFLPISNSRIRSTHTLRTLAKLLHCWDKLQHGLVDQR